MIVSIASTTRDAESSAMSPGQTIELLRVFRKQANNIMMDVNRRANLGPCCLRFLFIVRRLQARRVPRRHSITSRTSCNGLSLSAHHANIFGLFFFDFSGVQAEFIRDFWNNSDDFWDSLRSSQSSKSVSIRSLQSLQDRHDRPHRTQLYPSDRGRLSRPGSVSI